MEITLSDEQTACVLAATSTLDNLLISACAGGAKTTTMCAIARAFGPGRSVVALAFNKDAATALTAKMPYYVQSQTFHSFCYDAVGKFLGRKPKADGNRCRFFLKDLVPDWKERRELEDSVLTLVSRFKTTTAQPCEQSLQSIADQFDIEAGTRSLLLAEKILTACEETTPKSIDFDDMLWLAFRWNVPFPRVDVVLLDEAQDTNGVQRTLLGRLLGVQQIDDETLYIERLQPDYDKRQPQVTTTATGRLIAVGDPHQSIYGFRGADHDAMRALRDDFNMKELNLSVSYRCSQAIVKEAQKYL